MKAMNNVHVPIYFPPTRMSISGNLGVELVLNVSRFNVISGLGTV